MGHSGILLTLIEQSTDVIKTDTSSEWSQQIGTLRWPVLGTQINENLWEAGVYMMKIAGTKEDTLSEGCGSLAGFAGVGYPPIPLGTYVLRRTNYFNEAGGANAADPVDEAEGASAADPVGEGGYKSLLSMEQEQALLKLIRAGDADAKQKVVAHNLRLVVNIAMRYTDRGMALFDLVREGSHGLVHALENFELEGGFRFSSYASQCIREYIERGIRNQNNSWNVPQTTRESSPRLDHAEQNSGGHDGHAA